MAPRSVIALATFVAGAIAQGIPLAQKHFDYNNLPYQADTDDGDRGRQFGYNICNSTTENQESKCQTSIINGLDDWCVWSAPEPNSEIGYVEGESVAWCTKKGHGTRLIPAGAITGAQFMRTPDYVQIVGHIDQTKINLKSDDGGGEMDPHGADQRGNPLGGLVFSNAWGGQYKQVIEWHNFMGSNIFCFKACDPSGPNAAHYCEHVFDRIGCQYNAPAAYVDGVFESCEGESQDFPGVYTDANGAVQTYTQPPESLGPISTMPYTARIPKSSNCVAATSSVIFADLPAPTGAAAAPSSSAAASSGAPSASGSATGGITKSVAASGSKATGSSTASATASGSANSASTVAFDIFGAAVAGVITLGGAVLGVALL
ncbi:hypothetical protein RhiJN_07280 [Ceratobasidium sp. AG-Ba]|nr:hypothetical protein RhiJN_07280 [Ceratobasidium sp. AG-Ba]QRW08148.1 hypothetical protein RhiLY_07147 [Ceratobasidium sp. AG-Ba]